MLFNSLTFLVGFLPASLALHAMAWRQEAARCWTLIAVSLFFYGWWDPRFLPLLVASIILNWLAARAYFRWRRQSILIAAIAVDLAVLALFKYLNFFLATLGVVARAELPAFDIVLPLGISFFTFHHIIYLADCLRGRAPSYSFRDMRSTSCSIRRSLPARSCATARSSFSFARARRAAGWLSGGREDWCC
jgi:alginate O-acetyltransferase complex protein AlgI